MANEKALLIAVKIIKMFEGCSLIAYPDPGSDLYKSLSKNNLLRKWMSGEVVFDNLHKDMQKLSGAPWTIAWGETLEVRCGDTCTQEEADSALEMGVRERLESVLKSCPKLYKESPERIAACTSLAYNIGVGAFADSTVARKINEGNFQVAADAFGMWIKSKGVVMDGLVKRRGIERDLFMSQSV